MPSAAINRAVALGRSAVGFARLLFDGERGLDNVEADITRAATEKLNVASQFGDDEMMSSQLLSLIKIQAGSAMRHNRRGDIPRLTRSISHLRDSLDILCPEAKEEEHPILKREMLKEALLQAGVNDETASNLSSYLGLSLREEE